MPSPKAMTSSACGTMVAMLAAGVWLALATPAHAQIAPSVDDTGKRIYVNGDSPTARHGSTISSASANAGRTSEVSFSPPDKLDRIVQDASERHNLDPALVKAVISTESSWNPRAISNKGAVGLMQLIPGTAQRFGVGNAFDPAQNVEGGTTYLKSLLDRYNGDLPKTLAAYNAGERAVDMFGGVPAYRETQQYVQKVTDKYFRPGSGRNPTLWSPPRTPVRRETDQSGRVIFTNE